MLGHGAAPGRGPPALRCGWRRRSPWRSGGAEQGGPAAPLSACWPRPPPATSVLGSMNRSGGHTWRLALRLSALGVLAPLPPSPPLFLSCALRPFRRGTGAPTVISPGPPLDGTPGGPVCQPRANGEASMVQLTDETIKLGSRHETPPRTPPLYTCTNPPPPGAYRTQADAPPPPRGGQTEEVAAQDGLHEADAVDLSTSARLAQTLFFALVFLFIVCNAVQVTTTPCSPPSHSPPVLSSLALPRAL